jgi:nucleotide-binding universal stress UspA family protein
MAKKILIAVCNCVPAEQTAKYVATVCSGKSDFVYTLFHVQSLFPQEALQKMEDIPMAKAEAEALILESSTAAMSALEKLRGIMIREGIQERSIHLMAEPMKLGIAKDILDKAEDGAYDAIVFGRQGLTPSKDTYIGSIAGKVVEHALRIPTWIVAGEVKNRRILLPVDGTQHSLRTLDYVLNMADGDAELKLTLFHVPENLKYWEIVLGTGRAHDVAVEKHHLQEFVLDDDNIRMKAFYDAAFERIDAAGLGAGQVDAKTRIWGYDISLAILEEARVGHYSTVVVGRRGRRKAFFSGQIVTRLLQKICDQALWVIP